MKKQITIILCVALAAILLFSVYSIFLNKDEDVSIEEDPYLTVSEEVGQAIGNIESEISLQLIGYDSASEYWEKLYLTAAMLRDYNDNISFSTEDGDGSFYGIRITSSKGGSKDIPLDDMYKKHYNGTYYAYNGKALVINGIFALEGMEEMSVAAIPLSGYDADGDTVNGTAPYLFPVVATDDILSLTVDNSYGEYSVLQSNGRFFFADAYSAEYNYDLFYTLVVNCRSTLATGKMALPEGRTWGDYGLDISEGVPDSAATSDEATADKTRPVASYTLIRKPHNDAGDYESHCVYIGKYSSSENGYVGEYYARYVGFVHNSEGEVIHNLSKDIVYRLAESSYVASVMYPQTAIMEPTLLNGELFCDIVGDDNYEAINQTGGIYSIEDIRIDYYKEGISAVAKNVSDFDAAPNLATANSAGLTKVLGDKKRVSDYSSYTDGWTNHLGDFAAFTSGDAKDTYINATLIRKAEKGEYSVNFGLLRDEANGAYLPAKVTVLKSYDGINWFEIENGVISPSQNDKTVQRYEFSFTDDQAVKFLRFAFGVPQKAKTFVVFDEINIYADGVDAQPLAAVDGTWKLSTPAEYIPSTNNFAYLDMNNFNTFVESLPKVTGDSVVACGFSDQGDATAGKLDMELLAKYGLDEPARHFSFEYCGAVFNLYVSERNEEGNYYAYSTLSGEVTDTNGHKKYVITTTDIIVEVSSDTIPWLDWNFAEFLDHSMFSIYYTDITGMDVTMDGKDYHFDVLHESEGGDISEVIYNGTSLGSRSFKFLYQYMLFIDMRDVYTVQPGDNADAEEYLRIRISSETNSPEVVFYRVSATRCRFTINGEGNYYAQVSDVNAVRDNFLKFIAGETVTSQVSS